MSLKAITQVAETDLRKGLHEALAPIQTQLNTAVANARSAVGKVSADLAHATRALRKITNPPGSAGVTKTAGKAPAASGLDAAETLRQLRATVDKIVATRLAELFKILDAVKMRSEISAAALALSLQVGRPHAEITKALEEGVSAHLAKSATAGPVCFDAALRAAGEAVRAKVRARLL